MGVHIGEHLPSASYMRERQRRRFRRGKLQSGLAGREGEAPDVRAAFPRLRAGVFLLHLSRDEAATKDPVAHSSLGAPLPYDTGPRAIGFKDEDIPGDMVPVQSEHGVPQTALRLTIRIACERIVYAATPT